jgi:hypothetical protein
MNAANQSEAGTQDLCVGSSAIHGRNTWNIQDYLMYNGGLRCTS